MNSECNVLVKSKVRCALKEETGEDTEAIISNKMHMQYFSACNM